MLTVTGRQTIVDSGSTSPSLSINSNTTSSSYTSQEIRTYGDGINTPSLKGIDTLVTGATSQSIGHLIDVTNTTGTNVGIDLINNSTTPSSDQTGLQYRIRGANNSVTKYGINGIIDTGGKFNYGSYQQVSAGADENKAFVGVLTGIRGLTNAVLDGTNSISIPTGVDFQYGVRMLVDGVGNAPKTQKYGGHFTVNGTANANYGLFTDVSDGASFNYGYRNEVSNTAGESWNISASNSGSDAGGAAQIGGQFNVFGNSASSNKFGLYSEVTGDALRNKGVYTEVYGGSLLNIGYEATIASTTGDTYGFYIANSSYVNAGSDIHRGGFITVTSTGNSGSTTHTGLEISSYGTARFNYGINITQVQDADAENIGIRSTVTGTIGAVNAAIWGDNQSYDADGNDSQYGGYFAANGTGLSGSTIKYGVFSEAVNTGSENYGLRAAANGGTLNWSVYADGGRWTFLHNPNLELGVNNFEAYGDIVYFGGGGSAFNQGDTVYLDTNGDWQQTDAVGSGTSIYMLGYAIGTTPSDGILIRGYYYNNTYTHNAGEPLYLRSGAPGQISNSAPTAAAEVVRIVGYCVDATNGYNIYFNPSNDWVQL